MEEYMPDVFKGIFNCDEYGKSSSIREPKEVKETFSKFPAERR